MCGIFGAVDLGGVFQERDLDRFVELTDLVDYRGPDASGYRTFNLKSRTTANGDSFDLFLGHRRLSIIDLSEAGNQPFTDGDGLWIIYNGEIFNYVELKGELRAKGHIFETESDTEVILKVYREYGEDGFFQLNGMWALAIVDLPLQKLILSRDRFSVKPLYSYRKGNRIYFSSEIKQLVPIMTTVDINRDVLYHYLRQGLLDYNHQTFYNEIHKVKPMHNVVLQMPGRRLLEKRYWDYYPEAVPGKEEEACERFRSLFEDAVRIRLRSDVPVGCLLSGGLDSSSIAVVANRISENTIHCYAVISADPKYSEERFVDIVAEKAGITATRLRFEPQAAWEDLERVIWCQDEPPGGFSIVAQHQILRLIRERSDIKVVLSGQGGDETLGGYRKFFYFSLKEALNGRDLGRALQDLMLSMIRRTVLEQFSIADAKRYLHTLQRKHLDPLSDIFRFHRELEPLWRSITLQDRQRMDIDKYSIPALAHYEDRNAMAYSIEVRHPFLDHRLVNFALNLPAALKVGRGWTKYVLRRALRELPREVAWRRDKQGFVTPEERWLRGDFRREIEALFERSYLEDVGIARKKQLLACYRKFLGGNRLLSHSDIARFVMAELWARRVLAPR